ncbi:hypothetical protein PESP_a6000 [Pseudoalteromonas espejiana DSM 9414]|nr:hypothetical protein PESP_a6000 [Pseudoalteromonas espejiana DSM 9414]
MMGLDKCVLSMRDSQNIVHKKALRLGDAAL